MAWLAVNKDGTEWIMPEKPVRGRCGHWEYLEEVYNVPIDFFTHPATSVADTLPKVL